MIIDFSALKRRFSWVTSLSFTYTGLKPNGRGWKLHWQEIAIVGDGIASRPQARQVKDFLIGHGYSTAGNEEYPGYWLKMEHPPERDIFTDNDQDGVDDIYQLYQGDGTANSWGILSVGDLYFDHETDIAGILDIVKDAALRFRAMRSNSDIYDDEVVDSWATQVVLTAKLLSDLKIMTTISKINRKLTLSDTTAGLPLERATMRSLLATMKGMRFPKMAYALAEPFTRAIQLSGDQSRSSIDGSYFVPFNSSLTESLANALIVLIEDEYDSAAYATQVRQPLVGVNLNWISNPHIVPYYSDWGGVVSRLLPVKIEDSGVTEYNGTLGKTGANVNMLYSELVGFGEAANLMSIFRSTVDGVGFVTVNDPSSGKMSIKGVSVDEKTFVAVDNDDEDYAWLGHYAQALSIKNVGAYSNGVPLFQQAIICEGDTALDRKLSGYLTAHAIKTGSPVFSAKKKLLRNLKFGKAGVRLATVE